MRYDLNNQYATFPYTFLRFFEFLIIYYNIWILLYNIVDKN